MKAGRDDAEFEEKTKELLQEKDELLELQKSVMELAALFQYINVLQDRTHDVLADIETNVDAAAE